ncbi:hypothetical protein [Streptomyces daliensis]|uniref:Uncharacterized protein n=1 Tax=Streptomyces daliensis TaxID=299421 RepID=A0A8T4J5P2_9ACTN|nr:hypothetical protein [Streptomyces daliensis]
MRNLLGFVSFVLIAQGVIGLVHHFTGWFGGGLLYRIGFLEGYEVYASIVLLVAGVAVGAASDKVRSASS